MVYFSQQEFLAAEARRTQMEVRGKTPPLPPGVTHPPEHERQRVQSLLDSIPETQPGPNAFARPTEMTEKKKTQRSAAQWSELEPRDESVGYPVKAVKDRREASTASKQGFLKSQLPAHPGYQTALSRSTRNAPADLHPVLKNRSVSDPPTPPRDSDCTNITDFIKAGKPSPKLKLNATPNPGAEPTFRARVEERTEQEGLVSDGDHAERVHVFHPTPKMSASKDFAQRSGTPVNAVNKEDFSSKLPVKTPLKGLLAKLKLSTNSRSANPAATGELPVDPADEFEERMPVKAQALLGESPRKHKHRTSLGSPPTKMLLRSPSKRSKFFSRKTVENVEPSRPSTAGLATQRPPDMPSMPVSDVPQTAISDPTHFSYDARRAVLRTNSEDVRASPTFQNSPNMTRSKSVNLKYFDGPVPPTPPAKNTPPHEKALKESKEFKEMLDAMRLSTCDRQHLVAVDQEVFINDDGTTSTRFGTLGFREAPTLIAKASMYSLHASIVPDQMEASTVEEMEARIGGLDIEGFNSPTDRIVSRSNIHEAVYSPSNYSLKGSFASPRATPMLQQEDNRGGTGYSSEKNSFSSTGSIPIIYPDLASHPSYISKQAMNKVPHNVNTSPSRGRPIRLSPELTSHGRTHSHDHLDSDEQAIFAQHVDNDQHRNINAVYNSPSAFSHISAMPSPLQYLPATTYVPPLTKKKKTGREGLKDGGDLSRGTSSSELAVKAGHESGLGIRTVKEDVDGDGDSLFAIKPERLAMGVSMSATAQKNVFELPSGPAGARVDEQPQGTSPSSVPVHQADRMLGMLRERGNAPNDAREELRTSTARTQQSAASLASTELQEQVASLLNLRTDKLDLVLDMLNKRTSELDQMREEVRREFHDNQALLNQRLPAMENLQQSSPPITPAATVCSQMSGETAAHSKAKRVSTEVAHEFYRSGVAAGMRNSESSGSVFAGSSGTGEISGSGREDSVAGAQDSEMDSGAEATGENETIQQLQQTNRKLLAMVAGFAGKLEALEAKVGKRSG